MLSNVRWKEFDIKDLFDVISSNKIIHANKVKIYNTQVPNSHPYVVRQKGNNGIRGYIKENRFFLNSKNTITFAQDTFLTFYQQEPYFTGNNIKILKYKLSKKADRNLLLFISIAIQKSISKFNWGTNSSKESVLKTKFLLPIDNENSIDFNFIEKFINNLQEILLNNLFIYINKNK